MKINQLVLAIFLVGLVRSFAEVVPAVAENKTTDPVTVRGTVSSFVWVEKAKFNYQGPDNFVISGRQLGPRCWIVLDSNSLDVNARAELSKIARMDSATGLSHPIFNIELGENQIFLKMFANEQDVQNLKVGSWLELKGYKLEFNKAGSIPSYKSFTQSLVPPQVEI